MITNLRDNISINITKTSKIIYEDTMNSQKTIFSKQISNIPTLIFKCIGVIYTTAHVIRL